MDHPSAASTPADVAALYDEAPCGLLVTQPDGLIRKVNRTFCTWVGRDEVDMVGRTKLQDLLTVGGRIFHHTHWGPLMQLQGSVAEVKLEIVHRDGRTLPTVWNAVRQLRRGEPMHEVAVFIAEDRHKYERELLLARRRAEELLAHEHEMQAALRDMQVERDRQQALAVDRALFAEQMMAIVSHDLRNPLSVIAMSSQLLARNELTPMQRQALTRLARANERATRLISDLLDFSQGRLGAGLHVAFDRIDLHALVAAAIDDLRVANPGHAIEHRKSGSGSCDADGDRLVQLLGNLVSNAVTYGEPGRAILVTSTLAGNLCSISVRNEGTPIAEDLLPRLFDPMTRGTSGAGHASSVGLGLFIVREIAQAHGGSAAVASSEREGTTFTATWPRGGGDGQASTARES